MNSRRLARLMGIICEIKAHPRRDPDEMCQRLGISRRQFYKDRESLADMGFAFHFSRRLNGFVLDKELTFNVSGLSLADMFALALAVRELTQLNDFALAMGALTGLRNLVKGLPEPIKDTFSEALDKVVVADGFNCRPEILFALQPAIAEHRRVVLELVSPPKESEEGEKIEGQRLTVDPKRLFLREGILFLEAAGIEGGGTNLVALSRVRRVIATPFYSPDDK
jgi:predicted DNA-binding transcriptional regulator YafY